MTRQARRFASVTVALTALLWIPSRNAFGDQAGQASRAPGDPVVATHGEDPGDADPIDNLRHTPGTTTRPIGSIGAATVSGEGSTHLVFIPGMGFGGETFDPLVERLRESYRCHVLTPAGFGSTAPPEMPPPRGARYAEGAWSAAFESAVARRLDVIKGPVILIASQDGLAHALAVAGARRQRISGVVSIAGEPFRLLPWPEETRERMIEEQIAREWFQGVDRATWDEGMGSPEWYARGALGRRLYRATLEPSVPTMVRYFCEKWSRPPRLPEAASGLPMLALLPDPDLLTSDAAYENYLAWAVVGPWLDLSTAAEIEAVEVTSARLGMHHTHTDLVVQRIDRFARRVIEKD